MTAGITEEEGRERERDRLVVPGDLFMRIHGLCKRVLRTWLALFAPVPNQTVKLQAFYGIVLFANLVRFKNRLLNADKLTSTQNI